MSAGKKIIDGLKAALGFARCEHSFRPWRQRKQWPNQWWRQCVLCGGTEHVHSDTKPAD